MKYVGVDVHKQTITVCVVDQSRTLLERKRLACADEPEIVRVFENLGPFRAVVEATASYEWFVQLIEPMADKVLLAHPKKLRVIAESTRKSDRLDSRVLAEFLALDMIPASYRPTPRGGPARNGWVPRAQDESHSASDPSGICLVPSQAVSRHSVTESCAHPPVR